MDDGKRMDPIWYVIITAIPIVFFAGLVLYPPRNRALVHYEPVSDHGALFWIVFGLLVGVLCVIVIVLDELGAD